VVDMLYMGSKSFQDRGCQAGNYPMLHLAILLFSPSRTRIFILLKRLSVLISNITISNVYNCDVDSNARDAPHRE